jgi:16S rRNA (cytosine967-C5)-methyltransferase
MRVERESSFASELLHSTTHGRLSLADHALTTELVMGALRWQSLLDSEISESSSLPIAKLDLEVLTALRLAVYQLRWLDRIPSRAAIHESVELVKCARKHSAAPFANAVLRKISDNLFRHNVSKSKIAGTTAEVISATASHPLWLVKRWVDSFGGETAAKICEYDQSAPVAAIRFRHPDAEKELRAEGIELGRGALLASAARVGRGNVSRTDAFAEGIAVIQDEASQLVAALVGRGQTILDCCAAPGGKTAAIMDHNLNADITAVELHPHRARLLQKLLDTQPANAAQRKIRVVAADARDLPFAEKFERVLADVPCSGTGTLARNPEIKWRLRPEDISDLQERQHAILQSALNRVAQGGRLVYSTCSLEREENEDVVERALLGHSSFRVVDCNLELEHLASAGELVWPDPVSLTRGPVLRTIPGVHPCDGFFAAIIERTG